MKMYKLMKLRSLQSLLTQTESLSLDCEITVITCKLLESLFNKKKTKQNHKHIKLRMKRDVSKKLGVMFGKSFPSFLHSLQSYFIG